MGSPDQPAGSSAPARGFGQGAAEEQELHRPQTRGLTRMGRGRILDIEVLRALAVIGVVVHHARDNLFTWTSPGLERLAVYFGGWVGVDLFFVISGFVIARSLLPQLQSAGIQL